MLSNLAFHRRALIYALAAGVIVFILWNIPQLSLLLYPFRLFVTFVHEASHGIAALISGGRFYGMVIYPDGSGVAATVGGARMLILPAGYIGAAITGALLFYAANRIPYPRMLALALGVGVIVLALLYGGGIALATILGIVLGFALVAIGLRGSEALTLVVLNLLAILTGLNAVLDLVFLVNNTSVMVGSTRNDAAAFASEVMPLIPASVIALIWAAIAVVVLAFAVYSSVLNLHEPNDED